MLAARSIDQWRCSETKSTARRRSSNGNRLRAATSAVKFASEPPLVSIPCASGGQPRKDLNQSKTNNSIWAGPAASSQTPQKKLLVAHSQSPSTDAQFGAPGTNARNRGWFVRNAYGAIFVSKSRKTAANG